MKFALKVRYLDDEILKKLLTTTIDAKYKAKKPRATDGRNVRAILEGHPDFGNCQKWTAHRKKNRCARCTNCKAVLKGDTTDCLLVEGAMTVVWNSNKVRSQKFYFCLNDVCHRNRPHYTNINPIVKENVTNDLMINDEELYRVLGLQTITLDFITFQ